MIDLRFRRVRVRSVTRDFYPLAIAGLIALLILAAVSSIARAQQRPDTFADLAEKLRPAVVNIATVQNAPTSAQQGPQRRQDVPQAPPGSPFGDMFRDLFPGPGAPGAPNRGPRRGQSVGSGFIIDARGYIVTNLHVIDGGDAITVTLEDNRSLPAKVLGRDPKTDLAVLKVESDKPLPSVKWGDSDAARVGDWILAIGNPFGLGGSVSAGIISARGRNIDQGPYDNFLQTDAAINRGNSGGPMFNMKGEVIGINTAIFSPGGGSVGVGFAIPANLAKTTVGQLIDFGRTRRGWLGVQIQSVTDDLADSLQLDSAKGALVSRINKDGPADKAGIEQSDVIIRFDGKPVPDMRALPRIVAETPIDKDVEVVVWRKGKETKLKVRVGELPEAEAENASLTTQDPKTPRPAANEILGMGMSTITPDLRRQFEIKEGTQGVVITSVGESSPAAEKGVRAGDVIIEVNQEAVKSPADVDAKVKAVQKAGRKSVLFLVERDGGLRFVAVRLES